jgi:hypothetical protein
MKHLRYTPLSLGKPKHGLRSAFGWVLAFVLALTLPATASSPVFSSSFDGYTSTSSDAVMVNGGSDTAISITGGGSNTGSPSGYWTVADANLLDLAQVSRVEIPAALTGGSAFSYGHTSTANSQFKKGAIWTTRSNFVYTDGSINAQIRYGTASSPNRGYLQLNASGLHSSRFNVFFEIKPGAPAHSSWSLSFRYGTGGTTADTWNNNTADQNGTASAAIYRLTNGVLESTPVVTFNSVSLAGAGPTAQLSALNQATSLSAGTYLLSITLSNKTSTQRATIDDLVVSASSGPSGPSEVILDNTAATLTGTWTTATSPAGFYGSNYLHDNNSGKGTKTARFTPTLVAGNYKVYARWVAASNHAASVPVDIVHANGTDFLSVNQTQNGGQWVLLGVYAFNGGTGGHVTISTTGTSGRVIADAVRFEPTSDPTDAQVLAQGLASWRTPDGDGISCAECHGPAGYDVAVFSFNNADLRRATAPHLTDQDADKIFAMIELLRRYHPPAGGLKDVATFRPFQPTGTLLGTTAQTQEQRDAEFGNYVAANFIYGQIRVDTLAEAQAVRDQLVSLDLDAVPIGIAFNRWSESVSRQGAQDGGKIAEWIPSIGIQMGANKANFQALQDAYIANPTDANFWAMWHKVDAWGQPDPHNAGPVTDTNWIRMAKEQLKSNLVFQHDELRRSQGINDWVTGRTSAHPFADQQGQGSNLSFFWDVADAARLVKNTPFANLPVRHQQTMWISGSETITVQINRLRNTWFWLGWTTDNSLFGTGPSNPTRSGEYFIEQLWAENMRTHQVFFNTVHVIKRAFQPGAWIAGGNFSAPVQHFNSQKPYYLAYNKYQKGNDATGYPGSAAVYKNQLANSIRVFALLHDKDIKDKGAVYTVSGGGKTTILNHIETMRAALDWADPSNKTQNDGILNNLIATVNAYPQGN